MPMQHESHPTFSSVADKYILPLSGSLCSSSFSKVLSLYLSSYISGYNDTGSYWRDAYESDTFQTDLQELLEQLKPLYENLHTYVRRELSKLYGEDKFPSSGHIPAHLLGMLIFQH